MGRMGLMKGKRAEREVIKLLRPVLEKVYAEAGIDDIPMLQRNTLQSDKGGYDIVGLDWLAIEVKHQESLSVNAWWKQTIDQAKPGQQATLFYRRNNVKWQVVVMTFICIGDGYMPVRATLTADDYLKYFERRLRWEVMNCTQDL